MSPSTFDPPQRAGLVAALPGLGSPGNIAGRGHGWPRRWLPAQHVLWLGPHGSCARPRRQWAAPAAAQVNGRSVEPGAAPVADALFAEWCAAHPGSVCDLLLSGHLEHSLWLDATAGDATALLQGRARQHWARFHGPAALAWPVAVDAARGVGLACTPAGFDIAAARAVARRHRVTLRHVQPAWVAAWAHLNARRRADRSQGSQRLAITEPGLVTWLALEHGRCVALARQVVDDACLTDAGRWLSVLNQAPLPGCAPWRVYGPAASLAGSEAVASGTAGLPSDAPWPGMDAVRAPGATLVPDFCSASQRPPAAGWLLCTAALAALAVGAADLADATARRDAQSDRLAALERSLARRAPAPVREAAARAVEPRADEALARRAQAVTAALNHPWAEVFAAVEAAAAGRVELLALRHDNASRGGAAASADAAAGLLRLEGVADDDGVLAQFIEALSSVAWLQPVTLRRRDAQPAPGRGLRFEVIAQPASHGRGLQP